MLDEILADAIPSVRRHRVQQGENLAGISKHYYGTPDRALAIWRHNTDVVSNPNQVFPGTVLVIPHYPHG